MPIRHTVSTRRALRALTLATLTALAAGGTAPALAQQAAAAAAPAASGPTVRPETAKPLQEAQEALKAGKHQEALDKLVTVEAIAGLTPYERYIVARFRLAAASGKGERALAMQTLQGVIDSEFVPEAERRSLNEALIRLAVQEKQFALAVKRYPVYVANGGNSPELRELYPRLLAETGDQAGAVREFGALVQAEEAAGRVPGEALLSRLALAHGALKDDAGYLATLGKLASTTGKTDFWNELIVRTHQRPGFADERLRLDVYRLKMAVGLPLPAGELGDMAFRANQVGLPAEAQKLLDEGFNSGVLGKDANAAADRKLREAATKAAAADRGSLNDAETAARNAKDGNVPFALGMALSGAGQHDKALAVMAQGQAKGGLRQPDDALLHLGVVQWRAGKVAEALNSFAQVKGSDGTAELARLWTLYLKSPARK
ncbi:hypothetical protein [Aquabacterium sp. OR-4]|uniref:hypothetical protein n=1 Tax=Aquabacterium sp. OR-4 TaxID=2978127 RepID=UPI0028C608D5|nr:hypothetical protein [Aquabacterium sp. OR-4]MDT7833902.1 hypothetical protein [Aquabacterium sp. OR-4]